MSTVELEYSINEMDKKPIKERGNKGSNICALILTGIIMVNGAALIVVGGFLFAHPFVSYLGPTIGGSIWYSGHDHKISMAFIEFAALATILQGGLVVFFMVLTCIGITSSKHTAHCYIGTYLVCLLISLVFSGVLFIDGLPSEWEDEIERVFYDQLNSSYKGIGGTNQFTLAFNALQKEGECCGINGRDDFRQVFGINLTAWTENRDKLPEPCDSVESGCLEFLQDSAHLYFGLLAGFALVCIVLQIPAFCNAMCLCSAT